MSEFKEVFSKKTIKYSGLFNLHELSDFLKKTLLKRGIDLNEDLTQEFVYDNYSQVVYDYRPYKKFTDYAKGVIHIELKITHMSDVVVNLGSSKKKMQKGDVEISVEGFLETDYENKWDTKPVYYFFKVVMEKFFLGGFSNYFSKYVKDLSSFVLNELKAYLNLNKIE